MQNSFLNYYFYLKLAYYKQPFLMDKLTSRLAALADNVDCCLMKNCSSLQCITAEIS